MDGSEEPLGSWAVFIGENGPTTPKITGRLHVTTRCVYFKALMQLDGNAGLMMGGGALDYHADTQPPFHVINELIRIPRERISRVSTSREWLILRSLHLHFDNGAQLVFRFGAASPRRALSALQSGGQGQTWKLENSRDGLLGTVPGVVLESVSAASHRNHNLNCNLNRNPLLRGLRLRLRLRLRGIHQKQQSRKRF